MHNLRVLALLLLLSSPVAAQRVGFSLAQTKSDVVTFEGNSGYSFPDREALALGVSLRQRIGPGLVVQPELQLVQRGWGDESQPTLSLSYLELPLLLRIGGISSSRGWPVRPVLTFGPAVSVLASCSITGFGPGVRVEGSGCRQKVVAPYQEDYTTRRVDAGLMGGVALEVRTRGGTILALDGRYEYGLTDIWPGMNAKSRNGTFFVQFSVFPKRRLRDP